MLWTGRPIFLQGVTLRFNTIKGPSSQSCVHGCKCTLTIALSLRDVVKWAQLENPLPRSISFDDRLLKNLSWMVSCSFLSLFACMVFESIQKSAKYLDKKLSCVFQRKLPGIATVPNPARGQSHSQQVTAGQSLLWQTSFYGIITNKTKVGRVGGTPEQELTHLWPDVLWAWANWRWESTCRGGFSFCAESLFCRFSRGG